MKKHAPDAIDLLDADHLSVHALLESYRELVRSRAPAVQRRALAEEICLELMLHAKLEEELFHPAMREALRDPQLAEEMEEPRGGLRDCIGRVMAGPAEDEFYDTRVMMLADCFERHVRDERERVFNPALAARLDLHSLGRAITARREELRASPEALREAALATQRP